MNPDLALTLMNRTHSEHVNGQPLALLKNRLQKGCVEPSFTFLWDLSTCLPVPIPPTASRALEAF